MDDLYYDLPALRRRVAELEEEETRLSVIKSRLSIGTRIFDKDAQKYAVVTKLKNGSNDFEADYEDGSYGRGYFYLVPNWSFV